MVNTVYKYDGNAVHLNQYMYDVPWIDVAHQGFGVDCPTNTLPAYYNAFNLGAKSIELDVRLTSDSVPVIVHDATIQGYTVANTTLATLKSIVLQTSSVYGDIKIPTLEESLMLCNYYNLTANLDIKVVNLSALQTIATLVKACGMSGKCLYNLSSSAASVLTFGSDVLDIDKNAKFHVPYASDITSESFKTVTEDNEKIVITIDVNNNPNSTLIKNIRTMGFRTYVWNVTAQDCPTAYESNPDYVEYSGTVNVKSIKEEYLDNLELYKMA